MSARIATVGCFLIGLVWAAGCQSNTAQQLLERELRLQEDRIYQLEDIVEQQCRMLEDCEQRCADCEYPESSTSGKKSSRTLRTKRDPVPDEPSVRTMAPTPQLDLDLGGPGEVKVAPPMPPPLPYLVPDPKTLVPAPRDGLPGQSPLPPDSSLAPPRGRPIEPRPLSILSHLGQPLRKNDPAVMPAAQEESLPAAIAGPAASAVPQSSLRLLPMNSDLPPDADAADPSDSPADAEPSSSDVVQDEPLATNEPGQPGNSLKTEPHSDAATSATSRTATAPPPRRAPRPIWRPYR